MTEEDFSNVAFSKSMTFDIDESLSEQARKQKRQKKHVVIEKEKIKIADAMLEKHKELKAQSDIQAKLNRIKSRKESMA